MSELIEFFSRKNIKQQVEGFDFPEMNICFSHGNDIYTVEMDVKVAFESKDTDGSGRPYGGNTFYVPEKILNIYKAGCYDPISLDECTKKELLKLIEIDYE